MPEKDPDERLSLTLPSLFGRRSKKKDEPPAEAPEDETAPEATRSEPEPEPEPTAEQEPVAAAPEPEPTPEAEPEPEPTAQHEPASQPEPEPTAQHEPVPEPQPAPEPEPTAQHEPVPEPHPQPEREPEPEPTAQREPVGDPPPEPTPEPTPTAQAEPQPEATTQEPGDEPAKEPRRRRSLEDLPVPDLPPLTAVVVVGLATGLLGVALTAVGLLGCELVTGAATCGGPGLLILVAIVVAMVLAGAAMLRMFDVPDAGSLSFLGVGVMVVVTLLFLLDDIYDLWMVPVIPVVTALGFLVGRWVTIQLSDEVMAEREDVETHDIR